MLCKPNGYNIYYSFQLYESVVRTPEHAARYLRLLGVTAEQLECINEQQNTNIVHEYIGQPHHPAPGNCQMSVA